MKKVVVAELRYAPTDDLGIPLPIVPSENILSLHPKSEDFTGHHEYFLYGPKKIKENQLGQFATRMSRILAVEREVHNTGPWAFHDFYDTSPPPLDSQGQANVCIMSMAGYMPQNGIDLWSGTPEIRLLHSDERDILRTVDPDNEFGYKFLKYRYSHIRDFLDGFVLSRDLNAVTPETIEEFLSTPKLKLIRDAGHIVLQAAIKSAVNPIEGSYRTANESGQLHPLAPVSAEVLVLNALGSEERRERLIRRLQSELLVRIPEAA